MGGLDLELQDVEVVGLINECGVCPVRKKDILDRYSLISPVQLQAANRQVISRLISVGQLFIIYLFEFVVKGNLDTLWQILLPANYRTFCWL